MSSPSAAAVRDAARPHRQPQHRPRPRTRRHPAADQPAARRLDGNRRPARRYRVELIPAQIDIEHLRERFWDPANDVPPPPLEDVSGHRPACARPGCHPTQGGPALAGSASGSSPRSSAGDADSVAEVFNALPDDLRRPVEMIGLIHLLAADDDRAGRELAERARSLAAVEPWWTTPAYERVETVRPDGTCADSSCARPCATSQPRRDAQPHSPRLTKDLPRHDRAQDTDDRRSTSVRPASTTNPSPATTGDAASCGRTGSPTRRRSRTRSLSLFEGDEGTLTLEQRKALVAASSSTATSPPTSTRPSGAPCSTAQQLHPVPAQRPVPRPAHRPRTRRSRSSARPYPKASGKFPTLLHDIAYTREETILLIFLRQRFRSERADGADERHRRPRRAPRHRRPFRPPDATDRSGDTRKSRERDRRRCSAPASCSRPPTSSGCASRPSSRCCCRCRAAALNLLDWLLADHSGDRCRRSCT